MAGNKSFGGGFADGVKGGMEMAKAGMRMKKLMELENAKPKLVPYDEAAGEKAIQDAPAEPYSDAAPDLGIEQTSDAMSDQGPDMNDTAAGFETPTFEAPSPGIDMNFQGMGS